MLNYGVSTLTKDEYKDLIKRFALNFKTHLSVNLQNNVNDAVEALNKLKTGRVLFFKYNFPDLHFTNSNVEKICNNAEKYFSDINVCADYNVFEKIIKDEITREVCKAHNRHFMLFCVNNSDKTYSTFFNIMMKVISIMFVRKIICDVDMLLQDNKFSPNEKSNLCYNKQFRLLTTLFNFVDDHEKFQSISLDPTDVENFMKNVV